MLAALVILTPGTASADTEMRPVPASNKSASLRSLGGTLESLLRQASTAYGVRLSTSADLARQRVTVVTQDVKLEQVARGLERLLFAEPDGPVLWMKLAEGRGWRLEQSRNRRERIAALANLDQLLFARHVEQEARWVKERGLKELETAPAGTRKALLHQRVAHTAIVQALQPAEQKRLMTGETLVRRIGDLPPHAGSEVRGWLRAVSQSYAGASDAALDDYQIVLSRVRGGLRPLGGLTLALVTRKGLTQVRMAILQVPERLFATRSPAPAAAADERPVTVQLAQKPPDGKPVKRTLDELLPLLADQARLNIIADGYLRPSLELPTPLEFREVPLNRVLDRLAGMWDCEWQFLDAEKTTVLIRAKYWWLEDQADIPDELLARFRKDLGGESRASLDDLAALADLREVQLRKLLDTGICPAAAGLLVAGHEDGTGAPACLRFYRRLPDPQKAQVTSERGLPLSQADPQLVRAYLGRTLLAWVGAVDEEKQRDLVFRILPAKVGSPDGAMERWALSIRGQSNFGPSWQWSVGPDGRGPASRPGLEPSP